jgi:tRNA A-37 threonylcarbamoyl transferase component Bud32
MFSNYNSYINYYKYCYSIINPNPQRPVLQTNNNQPEAIKIKTNVDDIKSNTPTIEKFNAQIKTNPKPNVSSIDQVQLTSDQDDYSKMKEINQILLSRLNSLKTNQSRLSFLSSLKTIHKFTAEHTNSDIVVLLEGYIVKKRCFANSLGNYMFGNEVKALMKLNGYPHFPKLIAYDPNSLTIYMSYCGQNISASNLPSNWKEQIKEISEIMETLNVNSNDMLLRNVCCLNGEIKIIDFGLHTIFGKTLNENISDLMNNLNSLGSRPTLKENNSSTYQEEYSNWKDNLIKYKNKQQQIEIFQNKLKIAYKNQLYSKDKNKK